jgi:hypothetical protein
MARIRTIKPEFFRHEGLYEAEIKTKLPLRIAYAGLWTSCDREGRFKWRPRQLKLDSLPYDDVDFSRVLDALQSRGFLVKYEIDGDQYGAIPSWKSHQVINNKELASILPEPPESLIESSTYTRESRVDDAMLTPLNLDQGEGKGKEGKGKGKEAANAAATVVACPPDVDKQVWDDWVALRKGKGAKVTETAVSGARLEAEKIGWTLQQFLVEWCTRGSQGLKAEWIVGKQSPADKRQSHMAQLTRGMSIPKPQPFWSKPVTVIEEIPNVEPKRLL